MKKYPKIVQVDPRGQIVIPKDVRQELKIDEGTGFFMYTITDEGILLKKIVDRGLENCRVVDELIEKSEKTGIKKKKIEDTVKHYKKTRDGNLEVL